VHTWCILSERGNTILLLNYVYGLVLYISERKKLHHAYSVLLIYALCISNRWQASYMIHFFSISTTHIGKQLPFIFICQNVPIMLEWCKFRLSNTHNLDTKHTVGMKKEGNCIIPTLCYWSSFWVLERGKLYDTYSLFMI
jgi:hypothetical protein